MKVRDAKPNDIIETLTSGGVPTGNIYKVTDVKPDEVLARRRFTQNQSHLYKNNDCRVLDPATVDGF